ncbi:hypothetical protein [Paenibacillus polymyxa]|uniref:hypothetical protein n=1 Tax=Paenibacillus polymyxa TaxID=1406 RepID=UPI002018AD72|nr:hypothetical protein [Paenibacillus polymyxa]UQQ34391.1 hypothetical protein LMH85_19440 [Paenibacillus polymyxa]
MSVFLLTVDHHLAYHSAHIQNCHVTFFNREKRSVDVLLEMGNDSGVFRRQLLRLSPSPEAGSVLEIKDMEAAQNPFYLRVVTNIYNPETLFILAEFVENGIVVAKRTASHFTVTP